jgi:hypothetical protein
MKIGYMTVGAIVMNKNFLTIYENNFLEFEIKGEQNAK